jgi:hypothetical protein
MIKLANQSGFFFAVVLLFLIFGCVLSLTGCGAVTPEQAAQTTYEYQQRYEAEIERLESGVKEEEPNVNWMSLVWMTVGYVIGCIVGRWAAKLYYNVNSFYTIGK